MLKFSPITPGGEMPGLVMDAFARVTNVLTGAVVAGSMFGIIHGFTQRGCTGITLPEVPTVSEAEGLNASAVAVALTVVPEYVLPNNEKMRAKKTGRFVRCTLTVTTGFTAKFAMPAQLVFVAAPGPAP